MAALGAILATLGLQFVVFLAVWGVPWPPLNSFGEKIRKRYQKSLKMGARRGGFSMIFRVLVTSGKQRLDGACAVGFGFGPLVFIL